jgi:uncharacterized membrane protein SpoIIM required for sporulation
MRQIVDWKGVMEVILCSFEGKKVGEIIRLLGEQEGMTYYLILWMLKHGILEIVS